MSDDAHTSRAGWRSIVRSGLDATRTKLDELEASESVGPVVAQSRHAAAAGGRVVASTYERTAGAVTQEGAWEEAHALLQELVDVVVIQQGMIEQLRERVVAMEKR